MKEAARNAIPTNGIIKNTGSSCYQLYVTKSLLLTEGGDDYTLWQFNRVMDVGAQFIAPCDEDRLPWRAR